MAAIVLCTFSAAAAITERQAVAGIIGESGGESFAAQCAVASCIRHRNSPSGIYGIRNPVAARATPSVKARALAAWYHSDTMPGVKYFGCAADAKYFRGIGLHAVKTIGGITFWK